jgi:gamma-glutamylcyclotransferase (GGCT)/AIG2-like uncharacterized protein YtfP
MKHLFVYGTLLFDEVRRRLLKQHYTTAAAVLAGYRRASIHGKYYPGLIEDPMHRVEGLLLLDVQAADIRRLDRFEGPCYTRTAVTVVTQSPGAFQAEAYVFRKRYQQLLASRSWDPVRFRRRHLRSFAGSL